MTEAIQFLIWILDCFVAMLLAMTKKPQDLYNLVRKYDPDRFLITMACAKSDHEPLLSLFAFNHEIAKVRETVSETQLGLIRLQWWHDALAEIYEGKGAPRRHAVVQPLAETIEKYDLPQELFKDLLHAREFDLEDKSPETIEGLIKYADFTATPLFRLACNIASAGDRAAKDDEEIIQKTAINYAVMGIIRAIPYHAQQNRRFIPDNMMKKYAQEQKNLFLGQKMAGFEAMIGELAGGIDISAKPESRFLRLSRRLVGIYLKHLQKNNYDVFAPSFLRAPAFKELRLLLT